MLAHASGIDEVIAFLAAPLLFLLYQGLRRLRRRPERVETDDPNHRDAPKGA